MFLTLGKNVPEGLRASPTGLQLYSALPKTRSFCNCIEFCVSHRDNLSIWEFPAWRRESGQRIFSPKGSCRCPRGMVFQCLYFFWKQRGLLKSILLSPSRKQAASGHRSAIRKGKRPAKSNVINSVARNQGKFHCFSTDSLPPLRGKVRMGGSIADKPTPPTLILPLKGGGNKKRNHYFCPIADASIMLWIPNSIL